jgi:hypothetical protein
MGTDTAQNDILTVMQTPLASLNTVDMGDIVYVNTMYTPELSPYVQVFHLPAPMYQASLGTYGQYRYDGIFQVDVNVPAGSGRTVVNPILAEIKEIYKPGTLLTNKDISVRCKAVWESTPYEENGWYTVPINVRYYTYTEN